MLKQKNVSLHILGNGYDKMISGGGIHVGFVLFQCLALPVFKATVINMDGVKCLVFRDMLCS